MQSKELKDLEYRNKRLQDNMTRNSIKVKDEKIYDSKKVEEIKQKIIRNEEDMKEEIKVHRFIFYRMQL